MLRRVAIAASAVAAAAAVAVATSAARVAPAPSSAADPKQTDIATDSPPQTTHSSETLDLKPNPSPSPKSSAAATAATSAARVAPALSSAADPKQTDIATDSLPQTTHSSETLDPNPSPSPSPKSSSAAAAAAADADPKEAVEEDEEEGEEYECPFCTFMKSGACKEPFVAWEKCIEEAQDAGDDDLAHRCFEVTDLLKKCMDAHSDYYGPVFRAEQTLAAGVAAAAAAGDAPPPQDETAAKEV